MGSIGRPCVGVVIFTRYNFVSGQICKRILHGEEQSARALRCTRYHEVGVFYLFGLSAFRSGDYFAEQICYRHALVCGEQFIYAVDPEILILPRIGDGDVVAVKYAYRNNGIADNGYLYLYTVVRSRGRPCVGIVIFALCADLLTVRQNAFHSCAVVCSCKYRGIYAQLVGAGGARSYCLIFEQGFEFVHALAVDEFCHVSHIVGKAFGFGAVDDYCKVADLFVLANLHCDGEGLCGIILKGDNFICNIFAIYSVLRPGGIYVLRLRPIGADGLPIVGGVIFAGLFVAHGYVVVCSCKYRGVYARFVGECCTRDYIITFKEGFEFVHALAVDEFCHGSHSIGKTCGAGAVDFNCKVIYLFVLANRHRYGEGLCGTILKGDYFIYNICAVYSVLSLGGVYIIRLLPIGADSLPVVFGLVFAGLVFERVVVVCSCKYCGVYAQLVGAGGAGSYCRIFKKGFEFVHALAVDEFCHVSHLIGKACRAGAVDFNCKVADFFVLAYRHRYGEGLCGSICKGDYIILYRSAFDFVSGGVDIDIFGLSPAFGRLVGFIGLFLYFGGVGIVEMVQSVLNGEEKPARALRCARYYGCAVGDGFGLTAFGGGDAHVHDLRLGETDIACEQLVDAVVPDRLIFPRVGDGHEVAVGNEHALYDVALHYELYLYAVVGSRGRPCVGIVVLTVEDAVAVVAEGVLNSQKQPARRLRCARDGHRRICRGRLTYSVGIYVH